jgi:hypothetical protein
VCTHTHAVTTEKATTLIAHGTRSPPRWYETPNSGRCRTTWSTEQERGRQSTPAGHQPGQGPTRVLWTDAAAEQGGEPQVE